MNHKKLIVALLALACGPMLLACMYIANDWLLSGEVEFLKAPRAIFYRDVVRRGDGKTAEFKSVLTTNGFFNQTLSTDLSDIAGALEKTGVSSVERQELLTQYDEARNQLNFLRERVLAGRITFDPLPMIPENIPEEFSMYFDGCVQFYLGETNRARLLWQDLLDLPENNRRNRATWAAFMLGKLDVDAAPATAIASFQHVRALARDGFSDRLGLASDSFGWEARAQLNLDNPLAAIGLYLQQQDTGNLDAVSLRTAARAVLDLESEELVSVANNVAARAVVSSYLLSLSWTENNWYSEERNKRWPKWLDAATAADTPDVAAAEQFAWIAYQCGQFETAEKWLPLASATSPGALWLWAKLKLRDGDVDGAAQKLALATRLVPITWRSIGGRAEGSFDALHVPFDRDVGSKTSRDRIHGEHGALQFQRRDYREALNTFLIANYWKDAAYVADRILALNELKIYVDLSWPRMEKASSADYNNPSEMREKLNSEQVRYLLARRLSRNQRWAEARAYYPEEWLPKFDRLTDCLRDADAPGRSAAEKARLLRRAARLIRSDGMELLGTAVGPDWEVYSGNFDQFGPSLELRHELSADDAFFPGPVEEARYSESAPDPDERFHYRFAAAELDWKAAELMPDQSDATAALLCQAGSHLMYANPQFADKFYKALVIRCGYTELGTAADRKRWFPKMDKDGRLAEPMPPPVKTTHSGPWEGDASL